MMQDVISIHSQGTNLQGLVLFSQLRGPKIHLIMCNERPQEVNINRRRIQIPAPQSCWPNLTLGKY
jgi:hypothetical protein